MRKRIKRYKNSIVFKITLGASIVISVLFLVLITSNVYSFYVVRTNTISSIENEIKIYNNDIYNCLDSTSNNLNEIASHVEDILHLNSDNESLRYFSEKSLADALTEKIDNNEYAYSFAVYSKQGDILLIRYNKQINYDQKFNIDNYIRFKLSKKNLPPKSEWWFTKIGNKNIFLKTYNFSGNIIAAFIDTKTLIKFVNNSDKGIQKQIILTSKSGDLLAKTGNANFLNITYPLRNDKHEINNFRNQYIMISSDIKTSNSRISSIVKQKNIFLGLNYVQLIIAGLGVISILLIGYIVYYLNREIIKPIKALILGTKQIEKGNLDYRVEWKGSLLEFKTLNNSFNSMLNEIKTLKISDYEKKIQLQKAELKYLNMQIRPHFFLNALTTIHSLSYKNKDEEIRKFIDALSYHLRYMFKGGTIKVTVKEEIEYLKNYFYMQEIRFPNSIFYFFDIEPSTENEYIPQFVMHTFIENSFKHAMTLEEPLSIFIKINNCIFDEKDAIKIEIEDSGEGFPKDILDKVNKMEPTDAVDGYKIGISNIKRTLAIFYGKSSSLKISNDESIGAKVEIIIPIER